MIGIVIPVYLNNELHADFTRQTIESIQSANHEVQIYIIVNYSKKEFYPTPETYKSSFPYIVENNPKGNHVSASWNQGIAMALEDKCDYVIVVNNDLVFHKNAVDNLVKFAQEHKEFILWTMAPWGDLRTIKTVEEKDLGDGFDEHPHFSAFMVSQKTMDTVGWFDENLKAAYHEDGEFHYRILLSGNKATKTNTSRFYHYGSRTIKVDEDIFTKNVRTYEENRSYIMKKWGVDFHQKAYHPPEKILEEGYKYPFNNQNKSWKDW